jgi:uncharacterized metal-binding protein
MNAILIQFCLRSEVATSITFHIVDMDFILFIVTVRSSSIWGCSRSSLRHPFTHYSKFLFVIHSFAVADLLFIIKDSEDEKRKRRSKKKRKRNEFIESN